MKDKFKSGIIKFWEQCCEKNLPKIIKPTSTPSYLKDEINLSLNSEYIFDIIKSSFKGVKFYDGIVSNWKFDLNDIKYFNINKKKLSIYKLDIKDLSIGMFYTKPSGSTSSIDNLDIFNKLLKDDDIIYLKIRKLDMLILHNKIILDARFYIISYNNIFIPITDSEYEELGYYEPRCRMRDDLEDIYRNLTLLNAREYREFLMWKEVENKKIDLKKSILLIDERTENTEV